VNPVPELVQTLGRDDGITAYTNSLAWAPSTGVLSQAGSATGESEFAFFTAQLGVGGVNSLQIELPAAYSLGSGDGIEFAVGVVPIPEPETFAFLLISSLLYFWRRR
jgi:hypothetical protein